MTSYNLPKWQKIIEEKSPREYLETAQVDELIELVLQDAKSETGNSIIIVYAKYKPSNRTIILFSVVHQSDNFYPAIIQLENEKNFLAMTPLQFQSELTKVFCLEYIKSKLSNLAEEGNKNEL